MSQLAAAETSVASPAVPEFAFLTNHGKALLLIAHDPRIRMRDIAGLLDITERATHRIVGRPRPRRVRRAQAGGTTQRLQRQNPPAARAADSARHRHRIPARDRVRAGRLHRRSRLGQASFQVDPNRVRRPQVESEEHHMYATVRRYEGIDKVRSEEITRKVDESLLPSLSELPGFRRLLPDRRRRRRLRLGQSVREREGGARVDAHRREVGARAGARGRASEHAQDHGRTGDRAPVARRRSGRERRPGTRLKRRRRCTKSETRSTMFFREVPWIYSRSMTV